MEVGCQDCTYYIGDPTFKDTGYSPAKIWTSSTMHLHLLPRLRSHCLLGAPVIAFIAYCLTSIV